MRVRACWEVGVGVCVWGGKFTRWAGDVTVCGHGGQRGRGERDREEERRGRGDGGRGRQSPAAGRRFGNAKKRASEREERESDPRCAAAAGGSIAVDGVPGLCPFIAFCPNPLRFLLSRNVFLSLRGAAGRDTRVEDLDGGAALGAEMVHGNLRI